MKNKYTVVIHQWFIDSKGFVVKGIEARDIDEANGIASVMADNLDGSFNRTKFVVIPDKRAEVVIENKVEHVFGGQWWLALAFFSTIAVSIIELLLK